MRRSHIFSAVLCTVTALLSGLIGCGSALQTTKTVPVPTLQSIAVSPQSIAVPAGLIQNLSARGTFSDGTTEDLTGSAVWTSSKPSVALVAKGGVATAQSPGVAIVTATSGNVSGSATFSVTVPLLVKLMITPASSAIALGRSQQFTAIGSYSDGSTLDLTQSASWNSSAPEVISLSTTSTGLGAAMTVGSTTISAAVANIGASVTIAVERTYWQTYAVPDWDGPLSSIVSASNGDILIGANGTGVYRSSDGTSWTFAGAPAEPGIESLLWSGNSLYAGTHNGVFVSLDEGTSWTTGGTGLPPGTCAFALAESFGYIYVATSQGIYRKSPGTSLWVPVLANSYVFRSLFVTQAGTLLAGSNSLGNGGGPGGDIWRSADGVTWTKVGIANAWSFRAFGQDLSGTLYAGAFYKGYAPGGIYSSTDDGNTWSGPMLGNYSIQAITVHGGSVYLGTREGVLFCGPQTWLPIANPSGKAILSLSYPFLGSDGIYRMDNSSHPALGSTPEINQVLQDAQGTTYWRSSYFGIWSSTDGYIGPSGIEVAWHLDDLMFLNATGELIAPDENSIYHRLNGKWVVATFSGGTHVPGRFYSHVVLPDGSIIVDDFYARLWTSKDGGSTFSYLTTSPYGVVFDLFDWQNALYAATELGNIVVSTDNGATWSPLPPFVPGAHNVNTYAVLSTAAGTLLGGQSGGNGAGCIFRYIDGIWVRSDAGIGRVQSVYQLYSTDWAIYAITDAAVYESLDDGQSWSAMSGLPQFFSVLTAEFRPMSFSMLSDGHLALGIHWEGRGAYLSGP